MMSSSLSSPEREQLFNHLGENLLKLRLPYVKDHLETRLFDPGIELEDPLEVIADVFEAECQRRAGNRIAVATRKACLKYPEAVIDETILDPERELDIEQIQKLATCDWVDAHQNVVITGYAGTGKSFLASALAVCALMKEKSVYYRRTSQLLKDLEASAAMDQPSRLVQAYSDCDVLILDDFGLQKLDHDRCAEMFDLIESRDLCHSTMIVSQYSTQDWYPVFYNATFAEAILDRLIQKAIRVQMQGKNMRALG